MKTHYVTLDGLNPVTIAEVLPGDRIVILHEPAPTGGMIYLRQPPEAITSPVLSAPKPNRGPYASDQPWKKGKMR